MRFGVLLGVSLGFAITCQALPAQPSASANDYAIRRRAHVSVVPALRGDLSVTISTYNMPGVALDAIRQTDLPCDWRLNRTEDEFLEGVCRKYLRSCYQTPLGQIW